MSQKSGSATQERKQAHGLTVNEMQDLQLQQISGDGVKQVRGNQDKKYAFPAHDAHLVHARIWVPNFNAQTGEDLAVKRVQTYDAKDFERMKKEQAFAGHKVEILHDGGEAVEGVEPEDALTPQIVSEPGAGLDLTKDYKKATVAELKEIYKTTFPDDQNPPTVKADLLEAIEAHVAFVVDEKKRVELEQIEQNRLKAAGAEGNSNTEQK